MRCARHSLTAICSLLLPIGIALGEETAPDVAQSQAAITRAMAFLRDDVQKWRTERQCATCHHGTFTVWTQAEAQRRGLPVDAEQFAETLKWTKERLSKIDEPRATQPGASMVNTPALFLAMVAQYVSGQQAISAEELAKIRGHLVRHQETGGEWAWSSAPAKNRPPPVFESNEVATLLALLALPDDDAALSDELRESRKKGIEWLSKADATDTTQAAALRLLWKARTDPASIPAGIEKFLLRQRADGGFAQLADRPSDAYATGQALYILSLLGVPADRPEMQRGVNFLVTTQRDDGSWEMVRRGHEGVTPGPFIMPITYFGSAWATLGLLRTVPK